MDFCDGKGPDQLHLDALAERCTCGDVRAADLSEAVANKCLHCCGRFLDQARLCSLQTGAEPHIITAIKLELVDIARLLQPAQGAWLDASGKRAADYALMTDNPDMWALFPGEIPQDVVEVLLKAREASCVCFQKTENLVEAADQECLRCCYEYRSQMGMKLDGKTALMHAALHGSVDIARLVFRREATMQTDTGVTALMMAAYSGHLEIVRLLAKRETKKVIIDGTTALQLAAMQGHAEVVQLLAPHEQKMQKENGFTALMNGAQEGHLEAARILAPLEAKMTLPNGHTAMMSAAIQNHTTIVQLLLPWEVCMQTSSGGTALQNAAARGFTDTVRILAEHEAKMQNSDGLAAIILAAREGHAEAVELLIPHEAKPTKPNGQTALISAASNGYCDVAQLLVTHEAGGRINNDVTATIMAIFGGHSECFEMLYADPTERETSQIPDVMLSAYRGDIGDLVARRDQWQTMHVYLTPLDLALLGNRRRVIQVLTRSGASQNLFAQTTIARFAEKDLGTLRFLSRHIPLLRAILPTIGLATAPHRSTLFASASLEYLGGVQCALRGICTPEPSSMLQSIAAYQDEAALLAMFANLKHVGFSFGGKTMMDFVPTRDGPMPECLEVNPLKRRQLELARKEARERVLESRQARWREVEAESAFNRQVLSESREIIFIASPAPALFYDAGMNCIRYKQARARCFLLDSFHFMHRAVQAMIDE